MNHLTKTEALVRAVADVLTPVAKELRDLGYEAEICVENKEGVITESLVVTLLKVYGL